MSLFQNKNKPLQILKEKEIQKIILLQPYVKPYYFVFIKSKLAF
mgnify:CR=1 FL=1